jgi:hypothetical protein
MTASRKKFERFFVHVPASFLQVILTLAWASACNKAASPTLPPQPPQNSAAPIPAAPSPAAPSPGATSDENAIRKAVEDHVRNNPGINISAMDMSVDGIKINGDQAQANATFRLKQGGTSMTMTYSLSRHADDWLVVKNQPGEGQFVHPPMDKNHSGAAPNSATPDFPDIHEFMKKQPPPNKN